MAPTSGCAFGPGSSLLRERLTLLKALDLCFRSRSRCSCCCKRNCSGQTISHKLVVASCAGPGTRTSLLSKRLAGTIGSPRLGIHHSFGYDHHDSDCEYYGRSVHVHSPWG